MKLPQTIWRVAMTAVLVMAAFVHQNAFAAGTKTLTYSNYEGTVTVYCSDYPGYGSISLTVNGITDTINCDQAPPTCTATLSPNDWTNAPVTAKVTCADDIECAPNPPDQTLTSNGQIAKFTVTDLTGKTGTCESPPAKIDTTPPVCAGPSLSTTDYVFGPVTATFTCTDDVGCVSSTVTDTVTSNRSTSASVRDLAGNSTVCPSVPINNIIPPLSCSVTNSPSDWTNGPSVIAHATCTDSRGCGTVPGDQALTYDRQTATFNVGKVKIFGIDITGSCVSPPAKIDRVAPTCVATINPDVLINHDVTATAKCSDDNSGCDSASTNATKILKSNGEKATFTVKDLAGNVGTCVSPAAQIDRVPPTCTVSSVVQKDGSIIATLASAHDDVQLKVPYKAETRTVTEKGEVATFTVYDLAGNSTSCSSLPVGITAGLKIVGSLQWQGNQEVTGQKSNFSDISKSTMRTIIRKNGFSLIRGMSNGDIVSGVKYVEGDYSLSGEPDYETLVLKNGNVTINGNVNANGKTFGIIVLRDDMARTEIGNVYVMPNVRHIRSAIYADGGVISTGFKSWADKLPGYAHSSARDSVLSNQLVIDGSIFTRNTIGWAVPGDSGKYSLPGGEQTSDFNLALAYDLNYLRKDNKGWDVSWVNGSKQYNKGHFQYTVIIYDSGMINNPPKGFKTSGNE